MRVILKEVTEVLGATAPTAVRLSSRKQSRSGQETARANELKIGAALAKFGHLRVAELARYAWPDSNWPEQMAQRTCNRMLKAGKIISRRNSVGGTSFVLTRAGANWLSLHDIEARHALELSSVAGATFIHRTLASRYLIERSNKAVFVAGEYALANNRVPFSIKSLVQRFKKLPDGLVWTKNNLRHTAFEWIEVENAAKPKIELFRILRIAEVIGLVTDSLHDARLSKLVIVFDGSLNHGRRLVSAANELWSGISPEKRASYEHNITLVAAAIACPYVWKGSISTSLYQFRIGLGKTYWSPVALF